MKVFEQFCKDVFSRNQNMKYMMFAGDFNMKVIDYEYNGKVRSFFDLTYQRSAGKNSGTSIDHIMTDYV